MLNCLTDKIGAWDGCSEKDPAVKYINDLPGFELDWPNNLTTQNRQTGMEVLQGCIDRAADKIEQDIRAYISPKVRMNSLIEDGNIGWFEDNKVVKSAEAGMIKGIQVWMPAQNYTAIRLNSFTIFATASVSGTLRIIDLVTGNNLDTIPFTTVADQKTTVTINKEYRSNGQFMNLLVGFDASLTSTYKTLLFSGWCGTCDLRLKPMNSWIYSRPVKVNSSGPLVENNLRGESHTNGLSLNYQVYCDPTNFICNMSPRLKMAMFYAAGIELMNEVIFTDRLNSLTTVNKAKARELKDEYGPMYDRSMEIVLKNLAYPNDVCFNCTPLVQVKPAIS